MKHLLSIAIVLMVCASSLGQTFNQAEYFIDVDPGVGNGTAITLPSTPSNTVVFNVSIPTTSLTPGFHFMGIRIQQADGVWGNFELRGFYLSETTSAAPNIIAAEYFYDADPGPGNGFNLPVTAGATSTFSVALPTASLGEGFHFIAIRFKDAMDQWGLFESRGFYVSSSTTPAADIVAAEYFFDTDPGVGNGTSLPAPSGATSNFTVSLPTTGLTAGFHVLTIRTKGGDDKWGNFETRSFYVSGDTGNSADIVAAEYYLDTDPGVGNATPLTVNPTGPTINQLFTIAVPNALPAGDHKLAIRVMDASGNWSEHESVDFTISVNNPPVANAGADQTISFPTNSVMLDGTPSSDPDGTIVSHSWTQTSGPSSATIVSTMQATTLVQDLTEGTYTFELEVTDNDGFSAADAVTVTVSALPNEPPVANAGPDQTVELPQNTTVLSGIDSSDPDGTLVSFSWTKLSGHADVTIINPNQQETQIAGLAAGTYEFQLTVTDNRGASSSDVISITVMATECPATPVITQTDQLLICNPPGDTYRWFRDGEPIAGETSQLVEISLTEYGLYVVEVTDNGCTVASAPYMHLITGTEEPLQISVHPNPVRSRTSVNVGSGVKVNNMVLLDPLGRRVMEMTMVNGLNEIDLSSFSEGMYYLIVDGRSQIKIQKL